MVRSFYIAATGMVTERQRMNVITNNITNVENAGFKADTMVTRSFDEMLLSRLQDDPNVVNIGELNTGIYADIIVTDFTQGATEETTLSTDLTIVGDGFFTVQTPAGERFTRTGAFNVDNQGDLVTAQGYYVLDEAGQSINVGFADFTVARNGEVFVDGESVAVLDIVTFEDLEGLRKMGDNTYVHYENAEPVPLGAENRNIIQGYLEASNVDISREITDMMMTQSVYESNQRIARMVDETIGLAVTELGRM